MTGDIEPLNAPLWFQRVEMIANGEFDLESALRHASHLLQLTPLPFRQVIRLAVDEGRFETLLHAGDFDTAARYLVAQPTALAIEHGDNGSLVEATISCVILQRVLKGTGRSEAEAILDAWTSCVLALKAAYGADLSRLGRRPPQEMRPALFR